MPFSGFKTTAEKCVLDTAHGLARLDSAWWVSDTIALWAFVLELNKWPLDPRSWCWFPHHHHLRHPPPSAFWMSATYFRSFAGASYDFVSPAPCSSAASCRKNQTSFSPLLPRTFSDVMESRIPQKCLLLMHYIYSPLCFSFFCFFHKNIRVNME